MNEEPLARPSAVTASQMGLWDPEMSGHCWPSAVLGLLWALSFPQAPLLHLAVNLSPH